MSRMNYQGHYALEVAKGAWVVVALTDTGSVVTPVARESEVYLTESEALEAGLEREKQDAEIAARQRAFAARACARRSR